MNESIGLWVELPNEHRLRSLAPRVTGRLSYAGEYGWALALDSQGKVLVAWDDGIQAWSHPDEFVLHNERSTRP